MESKRYIRSQKLIGWTLFGSFFVEIPFLFRIFCAMLNTLVVVWDHIKLCKNRIFAHKGLERKITMPAPKWAQDFDCVMPHPPPAYGIRRQARWWCSASRQALRPFSWGYSSCWLAVSWRCHSPNTFRPPEWWRHIKGQASKMDACPFISDVLC